MSDLLSIGASGVRAYQTALSSIGQNVANASTPGYTRRTVATAVQVSGSTGLNSGAVAGFGGVRVASVGRAWNDYQAVSVRDSATDAGRTAARLSWFGNIETALGDDATGVGKSATAFFGAGETLAGNPGDTGARKAFLAALDQTATGFRTTAAALKTSSDGIAAAAETSVRSINASLDTLESINASLRATQPGTAAQADLLDQRDQVLDGLATQVGVDASFAPNGTVTVRLASNGLSLIGDAGSGGTRARLLVEPDDDGRLALSATVDGATRRIDAAGGTLGGLVESAGVVATRRQSLDALAADFAKQVNEWSAKGKDANGAAGAALLSGTDAASLTLATSDPAKVAAASSASANGNLLALSALRDAGGVEARWNGIVTDQGRLVASAKTSDAAASARAAAAGAARDEVSGVDLDTEAAELLRYQQAYNASAKVIQTARETFQSILDIL